MRAFIVICLLAVTCADKLGYDYRPVEHSNSGLSFAPGSALPAAAPATSHGAPAHGPAPSYASHSSASAPSYGAPAAASAPSYGGPAAAPSFGAPALQSAPAPAGHFSQSFSDASEPVAPAAEYEKEFFSFSAPEEKEDHSGLHRQLESSLKKNLRVIFIKGPENSGLESAAVNLAHHAAEQQTAIYVLHKQADLSGLASKLNNVGNSNNKKPEVHFVKYRTAEDAVNAQRAIQAQYDQLGGSSLSHNGGIAPVLNFASAPAQQGSNAQAPQNQYLPSSVFRH